MQELKAGSFMKDYIPRPDIQTVLGLLEKKAGLRLPDTQYGQLTEFLAGRLAEKQTGFSDYLVKLREDAQEFQSLTEAVTIGETYFFREEKQFKFLAKQVFPSLFSSRTEEVRLWSAACSSGEEALSLTMLALEEKHKGSDKRLKVFASDINIQSLQQFKSQRFKNFSLREDGLYFKPLIDKYLERRGTAYLAQERLYKYLDIRHINLNNPAPEELPDRIDLLLLRNVLIYFDPELRESLVNTLAERLNPGGILLLSSTEVPFFSPQKLVLKEESGVYYFQKPEEQFSVLKEVLPVFSAKPEPAQSLEIPRQSPSVQKAKPPVQLARVEQNPSAALAKEDYYRCFQLINSDKLTEAERVYTDLLDLEPQNANALFLRAYAALRDGRQNDALEGFSACLYQNGKYWLARYYRGVLKSQQNKDDARRDFLGVLKDLESSGPSVEFEMFLEDFSPQYFIKLSEQWIKKLSFTGEYRGLR